MNENCDIAQAKPNYEIECQKLKKEIDYLSKDRATVLHELSVLRDKHEYVCEENKRLYEQNLRLERQVDGFVSAARALITRS